MPGGKERILRSPFGARRAFESSPLPSSPSTFTINVLRSGCSTRTRTKIGGPRAKEVSGLVWRSRDETTRADSGFVLLGDSGSSTGGELSRSFHLPQSSYLSVSFSLGSDQQQQPRRSPPPPFRGQIPPRHWASTISYGQGGRGASSASQQQPNHHQFGQYSSGISLSSWTRPPRLYTDPTWLFFFDLLRLPVPSPSSSSSALEIAPFLAPVFNRIRLSLREIQDHPRVRWLVES